MKGRGKPKERNGREGKEMEVGEGERRGGKGIRKKRHGEKETGREGRGERRQERKV